MDNRKIIGVLFADEGNSGLTHNFFAGILDSFKRVVEGRGYYLAFLNCDKSRANRQTYLEQVQKRGMEGVLIACINFEDPEVIELLNSRYPIAVIDQDIEGTISVKSDNVQGMRDLVNYIIEMGHRKIAYIKGDENTVTGIRFAGFIDTCAENGIEIPAEYIRPGNFRDMENASYQTECLLRMENPPTCIIYSDDYSAIGGRNIIRARGLHVPMDISIAGYDGIDIISQYEPRLTTVKQDTVQIGTAAADRLLDWIEQGCFDEDEKIVVKTEIIKGRTIRKIYS